MRTRLQIVQRRIQKAISVVRERGCPSITRYLNDVHIYPFSIAKIRPKLFKKFSLHVDEKEDLGVCFQQSKIIFVNVRDHRTSRALQKTIVHELTHYALRNYELPDEEFLALHAEREYAQCRKIYLTRKSLLQQGYFIRNIRNQNC
jgi:hypothetical protein|uniref:Uncharacterized protein n=1 Tax=viral metagenome TaxID=1070528 RepID=A0A6C0IUU5_9ZZZZ